MTLLKDLGEGSRDIDGVFAKFGLPLRDLDFVTDPRSAGVMAHNAKEMPELLRSSKADRSSANKSPF